VLRLDFNRSGRDGATLGDKDAMRVFLFTFFVCVCVTKMAAHR